MRKDCAICFGGVGVLRQRSSGYDGVQVSIV